MFRIRRDNQVRLKTRLGNLQKGRCPLEVDREWRGCLFIVQVRLGHLFVTETLV